LQKYPLRLYLSGLIDNLVPIWGLLAGISKRYVWIPGKDATMAENDGDLKRIKELIEVMEQKGLVEIEIKHGDDKIVLKRCPPQQPAVAGPVTGVPESATAPSGGHATDVSAIKTPPSVPLQEEDLVEIKSPIVGTFYATPSPDSEPYVEVGSHVEPQAVVCVIEAMKVMNEIKAETGGTIADILVTNGQAVEYGQVLFRIRPD
jgi:acetyl-CoA carboxylase biotin carboxyl carrier protein